MFDVHAFAGHWVRIVWNVCDGDGGFEVSGESFQEPFHKGQESLAYGVVVHLYGVWAKIHDPK